MSSRNMFAPMLAIVAATLSSATLARAAVIPAITNVSGGIHSGGFFSQTTLHALQFTPSVDIAVTALGIYDASNNGLATEMRVGMFQQTGQFSGVELARVHIPAGAVSTLSDRFRYAVLDQPLRLNAGNTYQITSIYLSGSTEPTLNASSHNIDPILTNVSRRAVQGNTLTDLVWVPSSFSGNTLGPNFLFEIVIPEPGALALAAAMGITLAAFARRGRRCTARQTCTSM